MKTIESANDGVKDGIRQVNAYYPFGMNIKSLTANSTSVLHRNEYLYNGKMFQDELGLNWLDYGARFYDPVVGRWWCMDPMAEQYRRWSPYSYAIDNPIRYVDIEGMTVGDPPLNYALNGSTYMFPMGRALLAKKIANPIVFYSTSFIMPFIGNPINGLNGDYQGYPSWAIPYSVNSDFSFKARPEMMGENIPFESGMELLSITVTFSMPQIYENTILGVIKQEVTSEVVGTIIENLPNNSKGKENTTNGKSNKSKSTENKAKENKVKENKNNTTNQSAQSKYAEERGKENSFKLSVFKNLMYQPTH